VAGDLAATGLLHFDGLVDSADGLLPHLERDRRLAVMTEPGVGAFGVATGSGVLLLRWVALWSLRPAVLLIGGLWCLSRTGMALAARTQPYAREGGGLATAFAGAARWWPLGVGGGGAVAGLLIWNWRHGLAAVVGALVGAVPVVWLARRRIGGYTGDVLGALGLLAETVGLVAAAAQL
jgi:adenosylcobinamide-GDP ribazoletransferase